MNPQLTNAIGVIVGVLVPLVGTYLLALIAAKVKSATLAELLTDLVKAAEQVLGPGTGTQKMAYVQQQAKAAGLAGVTPAKIEAAVYNLNAAQPKLAAALVGYTNTTPPAPAPTPASKPKKATS